MKQAKRKPQHGENNQSEKGTQLEFIFEDQTVRSIEVEEVKKPDTIQNHNFLIKYFIKFISIPIVLFISFYFINSNVPANYNLNVLNSNITVTVKDKKIVSFIKGKSKFIAISIIKLIKPFIHQIKSDWIKVICQLLLWPTIVYLLSRLGLHIPLINQILAQLVLKH